MRPCLSIATKSLVSIFVVIIFSFAECAHNGWRIVLPMRVSYLSRLRKVQHVLPVGQASCFCSRDACCLRDDRSRTRWQYWYQNLSSTVYIMMVLALDYAMRK